MPQLLTYWTEPPTNVRVYPCPACQETISLAAPTCRFCHTAIDVKVAEQLWVENQQLGVKDQQITTAIKRANSYSALTLLGITISVLTLFSVYSLGSLPETWLVCQLLAISYGAQWLSHNESLVTGRADYLQAVATVKKAMLGWAIFLLVQVALYLLLNGVPDWNVILELLVLE